MSEETTKKEQTLPRHSRESREEDTIELGELFAIIKAQKRFIFTIMGVVFLLTVLYMLSVPPKYESTALIQVENKSEGMSGTLKSLDSSLSSVVGNSYGAAMPSEIETALINSRFILQPTIETLGLNVKVQPHYFPIFGAYVAHRYKGEGLNSVWMGFSNYAWGGEQLHIKQFIVPELFYNKSFVLETDKNNSYKLYTPSGRLLLEGVVNKVSESDVESEIPGVKILVSDSLARPGVKFYIVLKPISESIKEFSESLSINDLGSQGVSVGQRSQTGILSLSLKGVDAGLLPTILNTIVYYDIAKNTDKKTIEAQKTLVFLDQQAITLKNDLDKASTVLSDYKSKQGVLGVSVASKALLDQIVDMEKSIEGLKLRKAELLQEYTSKHPYVIAVNEQQQKMQNELAVLEKQIKSLPKAEQKTLSLERDVKVKSQLYILMLGKIQQLQVIKAGTISDVRVLGLATAAVRLPSKNSLIALGSLIFGFILAVAVIFARQALTRALDDPDYLEERLGIPLYAILPHSKRQMQLAREMKRKIPGSGPFILSEINSKDLAIEGLRSLRTTLQFGLQDAKNNIIAILGSSPSIGKSFVSLNLTYVFADSGKKMLLIDADMRKGRISSYVCQSSSPGLADLLNGTATLEQAIRTLKDGQIDFIPTGKYPENPSELLFDDTLQKLLDKLSPLYDIIIIDTPPVLAVTDSMLIAKHTALNLLLLGSGIENIRSLEHTVKRIHKNHIKVDGLIFNNAKETKHGYGYGYGYGYGRGYGYYYYDYSNDDKKKK